MKSTGFLGQGRVEAPERWLKMDGLSAETMFFLRTGKAYHTCLAWTSAAAPRIGHRQAEAVGKYTVPHRCAGKRWDRKYQRHGQQDDEVLLSYNTKACHALLIDCFLDRPLAILPLSSHITTSSGWVMLQHLRWQTALGIDQTPRDRLTVGQSPVSVVHEPTAPLSRDCPIFSVFRATTTIILTTTALPLPLRLSIPTQKPRQKLHTARDARRPPLSPPSAAAIRRL
ncbi:hypothetical protein DTO217A2_2373 [Paecilomyces variotii]|nr:hypothetical protein DTO217A2_2373 [Paecilomyces variotii]